MAEWLGHLMADWPGWAIAAGIGTIIIIGLVWYWLTDIYIWTNNSEKEKSHGKK